MNAAEKQGLEIQAQGIQVLISALSSLEASC